MYILDLQVSPRRPPNPHFPHSFCGASVVSLLRHGVTVSGSVTCALLGCKSAAVCIFKGEITQNENALLIYSDTGGKDKCLIQRLLNVSDLFICSESNRSHAPCMKTHSLSISTLRFVCVSDPRQSAGGAEGPLSAAPVSGQSRR